MIRRIALAVPLVCLAALSLSAQGPQVADNAAVLPIRRVVLYKTGVGYFEHLGTITGNQQLAVPFSGDQLDDVLKSLTAVDLGNGRVTGVSYDSPTPIERQLEALQLPLPQGATTMQLLAALRGARIEVRGATGAIVVGRLLNAESRVTQAGTPPVERDEISLVTDGGELVTLPVTANSRIRVADPDRRQDLGRYLTITATNGTRSPRRMLISTAGIGTRQFLVSYVGEACGVEDHLPARVSHGRRSRTAAARLGGGRQRERDRLDRRRAVARGRSAPGIQADPVAAALR